MLKVSTGLSSVLKLLNEVSHNYSNSNGRHNSIVAVPTKNASIISYHSLNCQTKVLKWFCCYFVGLLVCLWSAHWTTEFSLLKLLTFVVHVLIINFSLSLAERLHTLQEVVGVALKDLSSEAQQIVDTLTAAAVTARVSDASLAT